MITRILICDGNHGITTVMWDKPNDAQFLGWTMLNTEPDPRLEGDLLDMCPLCSVMAVTQFLMWFHHGKLYPEHVCLPDHTTVPQLEGYMNRGGTVYLKCAVKGPELKAEV